VCEELVEDFAAQSDFRRATETPEESIVGKLFGEAKRAELDLTLDHLTPLSGSTQVCFRGRSFDRRPIADAIEDEVESNPAAARRNNSACEPLATHTAALQVDERQDERTAGQN
jgi:hypothetical protein